MNDFKKYLSISLFVVFAILSFTHLISTPEALIAGFLIVLFLGHPFPKYNGKAVSWLLKASIVGLGFGMNFHNVIKVSSDGLGLMISSILIAMVVGVLLGKAFGVEKKIAYLISTGTAICGGSAIAATAPVIEAKESQISVALGVVFLLNSVALILFPPIGHWLGLTAHEFGLWAAVAIHDTSSVVGAALVFGDNAIDTAVSVKLARALWIIPLTIFSMFYFKGKEKRAKIPMFIVLFVVAVLLNTFVGLPQLVTEKIPDISKSLLVFTLFLVGAGLSPKKIKQAGWKPLSTGLILWIVISLFSLGLILWV